MDLAHLRTQLRLAWEQMNSATHDADPGNRAAKAKLAIDTIRDLWDQVDDEIDAQNRGELRTSRKLENCEQVGVENWEPYGG